MRFLIFSYARCWHYCCRPCLIGNSTSPRKSQKIQEIAVRSCCEDSREKPLMNESESIPGLPDWTKLLIVAPAGLLVSISESLYEPSSLMLPCNHKPQTHRSGACVSRCPYSRKEKGPTVLGNPHVQRDFCQVSVMNSAWSMCSCC